MNAEEDKKLPCWEKVVFDTKKEAAAAGMAADWQHGASLKAYKCKYCELWHLATKYTEE